MCVYVLLEGLDKRLDKIWQTAYINVTSDLLKKKKKKRDGSFISRLSDRAVTHLIWREIEA